MTVQMRTVEFQISGLVDGTTPAPVLSFDPRNPNFKAADADGIVRFTPEDMIARTGGDFGLFDPDFGVGGASADRFMQLLEVVTAGGAPAVRISVVDAEGLVEQEVVFAGAETGFYDRDTILVPQGSSLQFSGFTATPAQPVVVRLSVVAWDTLGDYARLRDIACCMGGASPINTDVGSTFVYRPGGVSGANVYASFADLVTALNSVAGPKWVEVDDTIVAIPLIPSGTFDINAAILQGLHGSQLTTLRGSVGTRLQNLGGLSTNLQLQNNDPAAALYQLSVNEVLNIEDGASLLSLVASPVVDQPNAGAAVVRLQAAQIVGGIGPAIGVSGGAGSSLVVQVYEGTIIDANTLRSNPGSITTFQLRDFGATVSRSQALATGAVAFTDILGTGNAVPDVDNAYDDGSVSSRWRNKVSRLSTEVSRQGAGSSDLIYGINDVGGVRGSVYAIAGSTARLQMANPVDVRDTPLGIVANARADVAGGLAEAYVANAGSTTWGLARARTANNARIRSTGGPSRAGGYASAFGYDATIEATERGADAYGYAQSYAGYGAVRIRATERGARAWGAARYFGDIEASGVGATAHGDVFGLAGRGGFIIAAGSGSHASGFGAGRIEVLGNALGGSASGYTRTGTLGTTALIRAAAVGSRAHGVSNNTDYDTSILSEAVGSWVHGYASTIAGDTGPAVIRAGGSGASFAFGVAFYGNSLVEALGEGAMAIGAAIAYGSVPAQVRATNPGSFAGGIALGSGAYPASIVAGENGAIAFGKAAGGTIEALGEGSMAHGDIEIGSGASISATAPGSRALGRAPVYGLSASGLGSQAIGNADTEAIVASATNAFQFGPGTNSVAASLRVGAAGLHFKGSAGAFGVLADGQVWVSGGNIYMRTGGITQNLSLLT